MAVCTRRSKLMCEYLLSRGRGVTFRREVSFKNYIVPSTSGTRAIASTSLCEHNRNLAQYSIAQYQYSYQQQYAKFFGARQYSDDPSSESYLEEDFSRGYGGPLRTPVIDWRERYVVDYKKFAQMVDKQTIKMIDVREPFEIERAGCIEPSINIPFVHFRTALLVSSEEFLEKYKTEKPQKEQENVVLIDLRGNRSEGALRICHELGYTKVRRFPGGFREWAAKNELPVPPTYYEHGVPRDHWTNLKYEDLCMMIKRDNVYVIDTREPWELVEQGSITNALNIPMGYLEHALNMDEKDFQKQYGRRKPGKMDDIGFISWKGLRSAASQVLAQKLGYTKASHFRGGMEKFNSKRLEAERPWARPFPLPKLEDSSL